METILSSLNALVEKLGGDTSDNKLIVDALNDISEKFGGDADKKMIVDALNNIVENYSGGSVVEFRNVIITNNLTGSGLNSYVALATIVEKDGKINIDTDGFYGHGDTKTYKIVAPALKSSGDRKEQIFYLRTRVSANAIFTGEHISVLGSIDVSNLRYTLVQISVGSPLDIEITVANG